MAARPPLVALKDVRLQDGQRPLFDGVDLAVEPRSRAALVGRNGAGKSTLMKVVMGLIEPDSGDRSVQSAVRFAYVPQEPEITGETLLDYASSGEAETWTAESWLATFGLDPEKSTQGLSGGETRRAALAKAFAEEPDLLLLDEPTNHLDILAIELLENELIQARFALLVVSHDRAFLNRVTNTVHWLENRRVRTLNKGFVEFDEWSTKVQEEEAEALRRLTKTIERETVTFYSSITARRSRNEGRARSLDALRAERAEKMKDAPRELYLGVDSGGTSGKLVAEIKGVSKGFAGRTLFKDLTTRIMRGDRLGVVGPNGAGKTTLVKTLLGELAPDEGTVRMGSNLESVYLDQSREGLKSDMTLWDALTPGGGDSILVRGVSKHVAAYAKDFLFSEAQLRQPISTLSGGERNRLLLARALAKPANLLILDEPTNDLDMDTLDKLEELLENYDGTLILVSHDRDFIDRLSTSTLALNGRGDIVETPGGWTDFIRQNPGFLRPGANPRPQDKAAAQRAAEAPPPAVAAKKVGKLTFKDAHRLKELEALIDALPGQIAKHDATLADPGLYARDPKAFDAAMKAADKARADLESAELEWLELEEKKAALAS
ncbi:MAG: ABC-F family ATP-binding cassette domain-containing protein [Alphaproteobacteria bacterium]|jgi:ABC transport system ATP-binding/permease protein|uniref:ABC transporter ATP-binding protein uup n=1 Tax=Brevundimonas mediterranea TaxID=74329 RepID=A0A6G7EFT7_9CAUL|nr:MULTISPECIES: ABC-F family ATP-binding cassette domain-containing protein [Brevundimonas]MBU4195344.1 ABC-F family ATP-binding cassette domain-containing protein [Alphaproteobacteria bacterium]OGN41650.1 MAG: elongation factor 3 [Caulobacterales bacterium GWE1_67_11]OGN47727.1 MAG: elongation factor 3 [Caulobacterales bacterium RIFCSPHIGHO2_12_FULL_68_13]EDX81658.1 ABC transporter, ATP-binding protein [Brevundimonas sp. BAL3]MBA4332049.1 ABC transporter ATP-binding protein [Brevundimonas sp